LQFEYTEPQTEFERLMGGYYHLNAFGPIEIGDKEKFGALLNRASPPPVATVYINSSGGDVYEAMALGRLIRDNSLRTDVGTYVLAPDEFQEYLVARAFTAGICQSSATLMFLGGRFRFLNSKSKFGVHQFKIRTSQDDSIYHAQTVSAAIAKYLNEMEIKPGFLEKSASVPSSQLEDLDHKFLEDMGVITEYASTPKWSVEARSNMVYAKGERDTIYGYQKICLGKVIEGEFYIHGIFDPQGRSEEIKTMPYVEITYEGEKNVLFVGSRVLLQDINGWMNAMVSLSADEATKIANSSSFGIRFRHSSEAQIFLGIDSIPCLEFRDQLATILKLK
jgi:hypothetical protein